MSTLEVGYTGPLFVAARCGTEGKPRDTGEHTIILLGLAKDTARPLAAPPIRVRMEMTPEEAEDLARSLVILAKSAKK